MYTGCLGSSKHNACYTYQLLKYYTNSALSPQSVNRIVTTNENFSIQHSEFCVRTAELYSYLVHEQGPSIGFHPVKKFPTFYGARRFITAFTSARHLSLSWASSKQSINPHRTSWRSIFILFSRLSLGLPIGLFPSGSPPNPCIRLSSHPYTLHAPPISFFSILSPEQYWASSTELQIYSYCVLKGTTWTLYMRRRQMGTVKVKVTL